MLFRFLRDISVLCYDCCAFIGHSRMSFYLIRSINTVADKDYYTVYTKNKNSVVYLTVDKIQFRISSVAKKLLDVFPLVHFKIL